jgi:acyl carrier protein
MTSNDSAELEPRIRALASKHFKVDLEKVTAETRLREDLHADSLDLVLLVHDVEDEFGVVFPEQALTEVKTVGDAMAVVARLRTK